MGVPQRVLNWMYDVLQGEYQSPDRTYSDVTQMLTHNPNLSLRTSVYTYEHGHSALLLNAAGTLPVNFRGTTYLFPISIWMPHEYPRVAPMGYVTPAKDMAVRPGQYVSGEGRLYHPYLAEWREDRSSLPEFVSIVQDVFAREPPVISKQAQPAQPPVRSISNGGPPPVPPLPPELEKSGSRPTSGPQPPQPPPKPFDPHPTSQSLQAQGPPPVPPHPSRSDDRPNAEPQRRYSGHGGPLQALPPNPPQRPSNLRYNVGLEPEDYRGTPSVLNDGRTDPQASPLNQRTHQTLPPPRHPGPGPTPYTNKGQGLPPLPHGNVRGQGHWKNPQSSGASQQLPPPISQSYHHQHGPPPSGQPYNLQQNPLQHHPNRPQPQQQPPPPQPKAPLPDLLTSPFDTPLPAANPVQNAPPPPIPPNPQKDALLTSISAALTSRIHSLHAANLSALPALNAQHTALTTTLHNLTHEISALDALERLLSSNESIIHRALHDADAVLKDAKSKPIPDIDKILIAGTVVESQLYRVVVEERAIRETRAFLGRSLDRGRVGGEAWARATRGLAREEFVNMALGRKIAMGMGLRVGGEGGW